MKFFHPLTYLTQSFLLVTELLILFLIVSLSIYLVNIVIRTSLDSPSNALIVTDTSIKNNIAMSILHIHICNKPITKTLHHVLNVTSSKAELFAIRYGINQAINHINILKIIVVMDSIHVAKKIFDVSTHLFQNQLAFILKEL